MRKLLYLGLGLCFALGLMGCSGDSVDLANEGILVVGLEGAYAPFNWSETTKTDSNVAVEGKTNVFVEGYDVQIAKLVAAELNLELKIKTLEWDGLIISLKNNQIDMIIAGMSPTEKRRESIDFTDGYYRSSHVLLVNKDSGLDTKTKLSDFAGKKIAGQLGTIYADLAAQAVEKVGAIQAINKDTVSQIVLDMRNNLTDAMVVELPVAQGLVARDSNLSYVTFETGAGFEVSDEDALVSIGLRKNFTLTEKINNILKNITEEKRNELMKNAIEYAPE